jgi:hypothetical protein
MYEEMAELNMKIPVGWTFPGWMNFVGFTKSIASGSQNPHHLSIIFGKEDPKKNEENGRQSGWDDKKKQRG